VMSVQQDAVDPDQGGCANMALLALVMLWIGTLLGVSFLATPAKFLAPSLTLPVALDVGRQTFAVFNKIEWVYIVVCALLIAIGPRNRLGSAGLVAVAILSALQMGWLLPELDVRVGTIIAGGQPPWHGGGNGGAPPSRRSAAGARTRVMRPTQPSAISATPDGRSCRFRFSADRRGK